jgi:hypothetical protein
MKNLLSDIYAGRSEFPAVSRLIDSGFPLVFCFCFTVRGTRLSVMKSEKKKSRERSGRPVSHHDSFYVLNDCLRGRQINTF